MTRVFRLGETLDVPGWTGGEPGTEGERVSQGRWGGRPDREVVCLECDPGNVYGTSRGSVLALSEEVKKVHNRICGGIAGQVVAGVSK